MICLKYINGLFNHLRALSQSSLLNRCCVEGRKNEAYNSPQPKSRLLWCISKYLENLPMVSTKQRKPSKYRKTTSLVYNKNKSSNSLRGLINDVCGEHKNIITKLIWKNKSFVGGTMSYQCEDISFWYWKTIRWDETIPIVDMSQNQFQKDLRPLYT